MAGRASARTASSLCSQPFPARDVAPSTSELPSSSSAAVGLLPAPFLAGAVAVSEGLCGPCLWCLCRGGPGACGWVGARVLGAVRELLRARAAPRQPFHLPWAPGKPAGGRGPGGDPASLGSEGLGLSCLSMIPPLLPGPPASLPAQAPGPALGMEMQSQSGSYLVLQTRVGVPLPSP